MVFNDVNWIGLFEKRVKPGYVPKPDRDHYEKYDEKPVINASTDLFASDFESF
jgi:hypothetical protein